MDHKKIDALYRVTQLNGRDEPEAERLSLLLVIEWMTENGYTEIPVADDQDPISAAAVVDAEGYLVDDEDLDHAVAWLPRSVFENRTPRGGWNPVVRLATLQNHPAISG